MHLLRFQLKLSSENIFSQQVLDLHNNQITALPADINELKALQVNVVEPFISRDFWESECSKKNLDVGEGTYVYTHLLLKKWTVRQRDKQSNGGTDRQSDSQSNRKSYEQIDRWMGSLYLISILLWCTVLLIIIFFYFFLFLRCWMFKEISSKLFLQLLETYHLFKA